MKKVLIYLILLITFTLVKAIPVATKVIAPAKTIPASNQSNLPAKTIPASNQNNLPTKTISAATKSNLPTKTISVFGEESEDCKKLNNFLSNISEIDNCKKCYFNEYGNINKLNFKENCVNEEYCIEINKNNSINFENFPNFQELIELNIDSMNINTIPNTFFKLPNLKTLNITNSGISEISNNIDINNSLEI
eukprot:jgi/Orpsp1_1/1187065/evm.model.d7180000055148.1